MEGRSPLEPLPPTTDGRVAYRAVLLAALLLLTALLLREVLTLVLATLLTVILALPLASWTDLLERRRVPRAVGAPLGLVLFLGVLAGIFALIIPTFVDQGRELVDELPALAEEVLDRAAARTGLEPGEITSRGETALASLLDADTLTRIGVSTFTALAGVLLIVVTALYIAIRPEPLVRGVIRLFPPERRPWARDVLAKLREAWLGWLKGTVASMLVIGLLVYVGLLLIGVPFALAFAVLAALLEFVPYIGPIAAAIPAIVVALSQSLGQGLAALALFVVVNQVEGNVTMPLIMSKAVDLHPAVVAVGLVVIGSLLGIVGLFVAIPLILLVLILVEEVWIKPREGEVHEARAGPAEG